MGSLTWLTTLSLATLPPSGAEVIEWSPGIGGAPGYDNPHAALGPPERFTGEDTEFASVVSPFSPAWRPDEIVSIGVGGHLTLALAAPAIDDPDNLWGIDLIIFGNAGLIDGAWPAGLCSGFFGGDGGQVLLSSDGTTWIEAIHAAADGGWPSLGWTDAGPYDTSPGTEPTDPTRPVDPTLNPDVLLGMTYEDIVGLYAGSSGGTGIDIGLLGLDQVQFIRFEVSDDAFLAVEIDAVVDAGISANADLTGDGQVGVDDLLLILAHWGETSGGDVTGDGQTDVDDLLHLLGVWS